MPAQESAFRREKAVLFPRVSRDDYGKFTVGDPVEIDVRWVVTPREKVDPQSNTRVISGKARVDVDILEGSRMWQGELADWLGTGSAGDDTGLLEVTAFDKVPDLKARFFSRVVTVMRHMDSNG